ncbi:uncharacterized protein LOC124477419 isoform X3 [Hypomesus transpacificus]|uniref:uncharacterized protein LOC124477419 isoform X3 n=1 Tax=Hypomesus transpacificus TaxID=137520 RepID=UPI001F082AD8|nr:uncharacterized protein LOC124477419 isoform X3 [Hypomesus transpacificus]
MSTVMSEGKQVELDEAADSEGPNASAGHTIITVNSDDLKDALKEPETDNKVTGDGSFEYIKGPKKVFFLIFGEVLGSDEQILQHLTKDTYFTKVESVEQCDLILAFCPIVSRVGTDVVAFLEKCNEPGMLEKRLALVVLHHTFDPDFTIPDINRHVTRNDVLTVNFLFHATQGGLLTCPQNDKSLKMISSELGYEADHGIVKAIQDMIFQTMAYMISLVTSGMWYCMGAMGVVASHPENRDEASQPENRDEASQPENRDEASQPENRDEASQPENRDEASQPENRDEASQPENRDEASHPENRDEASQPENRDEASHPENRDEASHPENRDEASQPENRDEASHPENRDEASQPENRDEASQPENRDEAILIDERL